MLRHTTNTTTFETDDPETARVLIEQETLKQVYCVDTLAKRLNVSKNNAYALIREGLIRYVCIGAKNYRVSERAVQEFLGDVKAAA